MNFWDIVLTFAPLACLIFGFHTGMKTADRYHTDAEQREQYALRHQYARLQAGVDADDPSQPYTPQSKFEVSTDFKDNLTKTGRATELVKRTERR